MAKKRDCSVCSETFGAIRGDVAPSVGWLQGLLRGSKVPVDNFFWMLMLFRGVCHLLASVVDMFGWLNIHQSFGNRVNSATFAILVEERAFFFLYPLYLLTSVNCVNISFSLKKIYDLSSKKTQKWQKVFFL